MGLLGRCHACGHVLAFQVFEIDPTTDPWESESDARQAEGPGVAGAAVRAAGSVGGGDVGVSHLASHTISR